MVESERTVFRLPALMSVSSWFTCVVMPLTTLSIEARSRLTRDGSLMTGVGLARAPAAKPKVTIEMAVVNFILTTDLRLYRTNEKSKNLKLTSVEKSMRRGKFSRNGGSKSLLRFI